MAESILFLTGHLARPRLEAVLEGMKAGFDWKVLDIGVKVAALMTEEIIRGGCRSRSRPTRSCCPAAAAPISTA